MTTLDTPSRALIAQRTAQINARNDRVHQRCDRWAAVAVAVAAGAGVAWAFLVWATPCADFSLCLAAVTPTRLSPWRRLRCALATAYWRVLLRAAQHDLLHQRAAHEFMPRQIEHTQRRIDYLARRMRQAGSAGH